MTMRKRFSMNAFLVLAGCLLMPGSLLAAGIESIAPDEGSLKWAPCGEFPPGCEAALVWGDWEKGTHGFYVRAPKGYTFPAHAHTAPERILVLRGRMVGASPGGSEMMVSPGMYWGFAGKQAHWARCEDACLMYITYDVGFDVKFQ